jgi:hypothetical protein
MGDVVLKLPVHEGEEANLFGAFLSRFIESLGAEARAQAANADAPYLMVRSDPQPDVEMKVLIFQQSGATFPAAGTRCAGAWRERPPRGPDASPRD